MRAVCVAIAILSSVLVLPDGIVHRAVATSWTQTLQADFESGTGWNVETAGSPGDVTLIPSLADWIKDPSNPIFEGQGGWDSQFVAPGSILYEGGLYRLWFDGCCGNRGIGLATSTDGRSWTEYPGNPILAPALPWESGDVWEPSVIREENGTYTMWYRGGQTLIAQIGKAWSLDGINWTRQQAPVLDRSESWASGGVFQPSVLLENGKYRMWYAGFDGSYLRIGLAESSNGVDWNRSQFNPLVIAGPGGSWNVAVGHPFVVREKPGYRMWYTGCSTGSCTGSSAQMGLATSPDGIVWTNHPNNPVLTLRSPGWESHGVGTPTVFRARGGYHILYAGCDLTSGRCGIGLASPAYASRFVTNLANPVLDLGPEGAWDDFHVSGPTIVHARGLYHAWYTGNDGALNRIGHGTSPDGFVWTKDPRNPVLDVNPPSGIWGLPEVVFEGDRFRMWYVTPAAEIAYAESTDGTAWTHPQPGPVLTATEPWENGKLTEPTVERHPNGTYVMLYSQNLLAGERHDMGIAWSADGLAWAKFAGNPVLSPMGWEGSAIYDADLVWDGAFRLWYNGGPYAGFGYAESPDGLTWRRTGANTVLPLGGAAEWDAAKVLGPTVLRDGFGLRMWFTGEAADGHGRTGHAASPDGVRWTKRAVNPVMAASPDRWDNYSVRSPSILRDGQTYKMWYESHNSSSLWQFRIGYAESRDGANWTKYPAPVLTANASNAWESRSVNVPHVIKDGYVFKMWYVGTADLGIGHRIGYAESGDGINWTRPSPKPALDLGPPGSWDSASITLARVLLDSGTYRMLYAGTRDSGDTASVGYAESADGRTWTKYSGSPVLTPGPSGSWESLAIDPNHFEKIGSTFFLWYTGYDGSSNDLGVALSIDAVNWTKSLLNPILRRGSTPHAWDRGHVIHPGLVTEKRRLDMWYSGSIDSSWHFAVGRAESGHWGVGTLESAVFDSGGSGTLWRAISWDAMNPPDTRLYFEVRAGESPDLAEVEWGPEILITGSALSLPRSRYVQYRATLVSLSGWDTPVLREVTVDYTPNGISVPSRLAVQGHMTPPGIVHVTDITPELSWTHSDPDGDPQVRYEVRIGTTSGGGEMWAPGPQAGTATRATYAGFQLARGVDYYFAVRVFDGNAWSPWAEVPFRLNSPPDPPIAFWPGEGTTIPADPGRALSWISNDADGDRLSFDWEAAADRGFSAVVSSGTTMGTTSTPFATSPAATYYWRVLAWDGYESSVYGNSPPGYWTFRTVAPNGPPNADAGPDLIVEPGTSVTLNGRGTSDPDGDVFTSTWTQEGGPSVTLTGADTATPRFTPEASGTYEFLLTVTDTAGDSDVDTVLVQVVAPTPAPPAPVPVMPFVLALLVVIGVLLALLLRRRRREGADTVLESPAVPGAGLPGESRERPPP